MTRTDDELARRIARQLDFGADHVEARIGERLLEARKSALSRYSERVQPEGRLAWAGVSGRAGQHPFLSPRYLIVATALIGALIGVAYWQNGWQNPNPVNELADLDVGLLTDELPISAYLDKGFDSWLKRSSR
ncbi:MAG: DUF3619 family protein [Betaproteobacteria bacterium]